MALWKTYPLGVMALGLRHRSGLAHVAMLRFYKKKKSKITCEPFFKKFFLVFCLSPLLAEMSKAKAKEK